MSSREQDQDFMRQAIALAEQGMESGAGGPFGALVVLDGQVIGQGWNRVLETKDPTAHAEVTAIRAACAARGHYWLEGATLYTSCEPCPMCLAAACWARIGRIVHGASREDAAQVGFADADIYRLMRLPWEERGLSWATVLRQEAREVMARWPEYERDY